MLPTYSDRLNGGEGLSHVTLFQVDEGIRAAYRTIPIPARERWPAHQHEILLAAGR